MQSENPNQGKTQGEDEPVADIWYGNASIDSRCNPWKEGIACQQEELPVVEPAIDERVKRVDQRSSSPWNDTADRHCPVGGQSRNEQEADHQDFGRNLGGEEPGGDSKHRLNRRCTREFRRPEEPSGARPIGTKKEAWRQPRTYNQHG